MLQIQKHYVGNDKSKKDFSCDQCDKTYSFKTDLDAHEHERNECHLCQKTFKSSLQRHINIMHKVVSADGSGYILVTEKPKTKVVKAATCDVCKKYFSNKANLKQHVKSFHTYRGNQKDFDQTNMVVTNDTYTLYVFRS